MLIYRNVGKRARSAGIVRQHCSAAADVGATCDGCPVRVEDRRAAKEGRGKESNL